MLLALRVPAQQDSFRYERLQNSHDVTVPAWGPYTKRYAGISHISDDNRGLRFDLSVMPGFYRQRVLVPNVLYESGFYPWQASGDLNYFSFRQELEWKDRVYTDVAFAPFTATSRLVQIKCVNATSAHQTLVLHLMASLQYPEVNGAKAILPEGVAWHRAIDYSEMKFAKPRPQDNLTYDGWRKGEVRGSEFVGGSSLGKAFGRDSGDNVHYRFHQAGAVQTATLLLRYRVPKGQTASFGLSGIVQRNIALAGNGLLQEVRLPIGEIRAGQQALEMTSLGKSEIDLDGFALLPNENDSVHYETAFNPVPFIQKNLPERTLRLTYKDLPQQYGIAWGGVEGTVRQFFTDAVDVALPLTVNNHGDSVFTDNNKGHFTDLYLQPVRLKPHEIKTVYAVVGSGNEMEVEKTLQAFKQTKACEAFFSAYESEVANQGFNQSGNKYRFGQQIIRANTLQNVVFPVYTAGQYIRHFTPGRWWNSLYTWDAGFIGLGMSELDTAKAIEILNAYTTPATDSNAFVHHGSMVPVQAFLFQQLCNHIRSKAFMAYFYPRLKKYYGFYAGHTGSSTTRIKGSNLLRTWDYFYNSGGWDDYSPQKFTRGKKEYTDYLAPVITTSLAVRFAKILKEAAVMLGENADTLFYRNDIRDFEAALQKYSWDEASGYYGYLLHDSAGRPKGLLRTAGGENFNKGMDGVYPLAAGIATPTQQNVLLNHLFSPKQLWTPVGLTAVDQSASYYSPEGYWNGTVWMPHQWVFWKTMLDLGEGDKAFRIAKRALDTWEREAELSYHSAEHFSVETGRGAGWHQFSALSAPILNWFAAYFKQGTVTTGFDTWIKGQTMADGNKTLRATLHRASNKKSVVIACVKEGHRYSVRANGKPLSYKEVVGGALQIVLPATLSLTIQLEIKSLK